MLSQTLTKCFTSTVQDGESDPMVKTNVVDGLYAIADAILALANAISEGLAQRQPPPQP